MATVKIIDPVTRVEGHMSVEVTIDNGKVVDAYCTGTLFRGFETILNGRDAWDAPVITQRICGVCPVSHATASVLALESIGAKTVPDNARILRNLTLGANYIQSHILHFYFLAARDYIKLLNAAPWAPAWDVDMRIPATDSVNGHLPQAIEARRRAHEMGAIFGGRMPMAHTFIPGGFTAVPSQQSIDQYLAQLDWLINFIRNVYIPDVQAIGAVYSDYFSIGGGDKNLFAFGAFDLNAGGTQKLLGRGYIENGQTGAPAALNLNDISESVTYSWYNDSANNLHPSSGSTVPQNPKGSAYSWLKAPRYMGKPFEAGPLARMWINGDYQRGISVMDRHMARATEALKVAEAMRGWLGSLRIGNPVYVDGSVTSGSGVGLTEAARGALGHWVLASSGKISRYQVITPTCWNASPRDSQNVPGPMEKALIGITVADANQPVEVLRVIHSYDPCLACAVHVIKPKSRARIVSVKPRY